MAATLVSRVYTLEHDDQITVSTSDASDKTFTISQDGTEVIIYLAAIPDLIEALSALSA